MTFILPHSAYIHSIFVGQPKTITDERGIWTSSIYRDPVTGPVQVQKSGRLSLVPIDKIRRIMGGPKRAFFFFSCEIWHIFVHVPNNKEIRKIKEAAAQTG